MKGKQRPERNAPTGRCFLYTGKSIHCEFDIGRFSKIDPCGGNGIHAADGNQQGTGADGPDGFASFRQYIRRELIELENIRPSADQRNRVFQRVHFHGDFSVQKDLPPLN
ncbi:MAG: hypothetical protein ABF904_13610 [Ethanoligenens sp.]